LFREFTLRARVNIKCQVVNGTISAPAGNLHHVGGPEVEEESGARIRPPVSGHHWVQHHLNIKRNSRLLSKYHFDFVSLNERVCRRNSKRSSILFTGTTLNHLLIFKEKAGRYQCFLTKCLIILIYFIDSAALIRNSADKPQNPNFHTEKQGYLICSLSDIG